MPKFAIDRSAFSYNAKEDHYEGSVRINGTRYRGTVKSWDGSIEKAWANADRVFGFISGQFDKVESAVKRKFIPEVRL
jgi:hypothetical protein